MDTEFVRLKGGMVEEGTTARPSQAAENERNCCANHVVSACMSMNTIDGAQLTFDLSLRTA